MLGVPSRVDKGMYGQPLVRMSFTVRVSLKKSTSRKDATELILLVLPLIIAVG